LYDPDGIGVARESAAHTLKISSALVYWWDFSGVLGNSRGLGKKIKHFWGAGRHRPQGLFLCLGGGATSENNSLGRPAGKPGTKFFTAPPPKKGVLTRGTFPGSASNYDSAKKLIGKSKIKKNSRLGGLNGERGERGGEKKKAGEGGGRRKEGGTGVEGRRGRGGGKGGKGKNNWKE